MSYFGTAVGYVFLAFGALTTLGNLAGIVDYLRHGRTLTFIPVFGGVSCAIGASMSLELPLSLSVGIPILVDPGCAFVLAVVALRRPPPGMDPTEE